MRFVNSIVLSASNAAGANGIAIDANQLVSASFQAIFGDATAAGSIKVQASNDIDNHGYMSASQFTPTNWTDIPSATASIVAGSSGLVTIPQLSYRWLRVVYTSTTPGSTTITVQLFALST